MSTEENLLSRRNFMELLVALGLSPVVAISGESAVLAPGRYRPGRVDNEYALFLPGEQAALKTPPAVTSVTTDTVTASLMGLSRQMRTGDHLEGWCLQGIVRVNGALTAIFEKHVSHRGAIAYVTEKDGLTVYIPKSIGKLANIRPRAIQTPHGVKLVRATSFEPGRTDITGEYILNSAEDPCYENVAALGAEYIGWTLVANEELGPQGSLYLDASGVSRQFAQQVAVIEELSPASAVAPRTSGLWAPDASGPTFDPMTLSPAAGVAPERYEYVRGYSKRTLLGGYLPVADIGVWNSTHDSGYEIMVLLPPGEKATPVGRLRFAASTETLEQLRSDQEELRKDPDLGLLASVYDNPAVNPHAIVTAENGRTYYETYWNGTAESFYAGLAAIWMRWHNFHEQAMQVDIPDSWLLEAAQAGLTLARCSYRGLEPTYQIGEGAYTAFHKASDCPERSRLRRRLPFPMLSSPSRTMSLSGPINFGTTLRKATGIFNTTWTTTSFRTETFSTTRRIKSKRRSISVCFSPTRRVPIFMAAISLPLKGACPSSSA